VGAWIRHFFPSDIGTFLAWNYITIMADLTEQFINYNRKRWNFFERLGNYKNRDI